MAHKEFVVAARITLYKNGLDNVKLSYDQLIDRVQQVNIKMACRIEYRNA